MWAISLSLSLFSGCIYDGVVHLEGSTWFASSSPCMSCMCVNGVTTCSGPLSVHLSKPDQRAGRMLPSVCRYSYNPYKPFCACIVSSLWKSPVWNVFFFCQTVCMKAVCTALERVSTPLMTPVRSAPVRYSSSQHDVCMCWFSHLTGVCVLKVMPDGEQHLRCYRKQCPSLVDCPKHNILHSGSDSCCPVCAR